MNYSPGKSNFKIEYVCLTTHRFKIGDIHFQDSLRYPTFPQEYQSWKNQLQNVFIDVKRPINSKNCLIHFQENLKYLTFPQEFQAWKNQLRSWCLATHRLKIEGQDFIIHFQVSSKYPKCPPRSPVLEKSTSKLIYWRLTTHRHKIISRSFSEEPKIPKMSPKKSSPGKINFKINVLMLNDSSTQNTFSLLFRRA